MPKRTAFVLAVHKNPNQLNTFIKQLISLKQADVYIHIDKKSVAQLRPHILKDPHVQIANDSIEVNWGDISQVDATISLLKRVIASKVNYDFVCFRSGQDLLVANGLKEYLFNNPQSIFITADQNCSGAHLNIKWPQFARKQYDTYHPFRILRSLLIRSYNHGLNLLPNPHKLKNFNIYHGSSWFCMPLEVVEYVVDFIENNPWYYDSFINALCPDEWFFQTLIMNSDYKDFVVNDNLTYLRWGETLQTSNHPIVLQFDDVKTVETSGTFFARKFDENIDSEVIKYFGEKVQI